MDVLPPNHYLFSYLFIIIVIIIIIIILKSLPFQFDHMCPKVQFLFVLSISLPSAYLQAVLRKNNALI